MTTLYMINGFLAGDSNHAEFLNSPRYEDKKVYVSKHNYVAYAVGGTSRSESEMLQYGKMLEIMQAALRLKDREKWMELYDKLINDLGSSTMFILTLAGGKPIMTTLDKNNGMDIEFRPDGVGYGTGEKFARAQFHLQRMRDEFDIREMMEVAAKYDPQTKGEITIVNAYTLRDEDEITEEYYKELLGEEK